MESTSEMTVTAVQLIQDESIDAGLVLVTAEAVGVGDAVTGVNFLGNVKDGWCVSNHVKVTVEWKSDNPEWTNHVLERSFLVDGLSPDDFTPDSIDSATFMEDEF